MSFAVPLISAVIAGLVAWIVARQQGRTSRENWVLDKRFVLYERVLAAAAPLDGRTVSQVAKNARVPTITGPLHASLIGMTLLAPLAVQERMARVSKLLEQLEVGRSDVGQDFIDALGQLMEALRSDLVPKHMR